MHMTNRGLLALAHHEGIVPAPYRDIRGIWTLGLGHTAAAGAPDPADLPRGMPEGLDAAIREAFHLFRVDLIRTEMAVARAVTVPLKPHERDALISFHYNTGAIARATLTQRLNAGDRAGAAEAFLNWRKPAEIIPRREAERDLFRDGRYPVGSIPVWGVDGNGRLDLSRPIRSLSETEALALLAPPRATGLSQRIEPGARAPVPITVRPASSNHQGLTPNGTPPAPRPAPAHPAPNVVPLSPAKRAWLDRLFPALAQLLRRV